ncbi:MAG: glycosyltransferase family 9 protein [Candidatus Zixiibacteriota bacterium]
MSLLNWLEHRTKDAVFGLCRLFFRKGRTPAPAIDGARISKVLFLRPEKIGDMVISLPVFDALRTRYPHIRISVLASPRNVALIRNDSRFERIFIYRKWQWEDFRQLAAVRREHFDCVIDMIDNDSVTALFFSQLAGKRSVRIGVGKTRHAIFYDYNHIHSDGIGEHIVDNTLKLLAPFGINGSTVSGFAPPFMTAEARAKAEAAVAIDPPGTLRFGFNLSAGKPNRIWPREKVIALCRALISWKADSRIVLISMPSDRRNAEEVAAEAGDRVRLAPAGMGLIEVSALIARLDLLISPDTSLIHIARSFQIPVVGLYNRAAKNFRRWQPYRQPDGAVVGADDDTIADISVDRVFERVKQVLARMKAGQE